MRSIRLAVANDPRRFGRRNPYQAMSIDEPRQVSTLDDLKLFAMTFLGGFLFVAIYLG